MKKTRDIIFGAALIAVGVIWGINALGIADINIFFDGWWTVFIIVPSICAVFSRGDRIGGLFGLLAGVLLLLAARDVIGYNMVWKILLPVVIVGLGVKIIINSLNSSKPPLLKGGVKQSGQHNAVFGGNEINFDNEEFKGTSLTAIFGGIECNLRNAIINEDIRIDATAVFGGIDLSVPVNINVKVSSNSIFGGIEWQKNKPYIPDAPTLYINGTCIFGGIEIKY